MKKETLVVPVGGTKAVDVMRAKSIECPMADLLS